MMRPILLLLATGTAVGLSGCTQPDGMPDFGHPEDPDNIIFIDDEVDLAIVGGIAIGLATAGLVLAQALRMTPKSGTLPQVSP